MSYSLDDIMHESGKCFVLRVKRPRLNNTPYIFYELYKNGITHAAKIGTYGNGLYDRAVIDCEKKGKLNNNQ